VQSTRFVWQENSRRLKAHFVSVRGANFHLLSKSDIIYYPKLPDTTPANGKSGGDTVALG
jgi:hypothetical protein